MDDSELAARPDTLGFTTQPLDAALEIHGRPGLTLAHRTDNPHADLFVRVSELFPDGSSRNVSEGFTRLDPTAANGDILMELDPTAHRFQAGNRIRLVIAGGCFPRWERNLGTGENPVTGSRMAPSTRTIALDGTALLLPVYDEQHSQVS